MNHSGVEFTKLSPRAMTQRIRTTISLTPEAHAIFTAMAEAAGISLSRCMGDWLSDTSEGAQFVTSRILAARQAPASVLREFQAMARDGANLVDAEVERVLRSASAGHSAAGGHRGPPPSHTGVKSPINKPKTGGKGQRRAV